MTGPWNKREGAVADALGQDFRLLRRRNTVFLTGDHQRRHFDLGQRAARIGVIERANRCPGDEFRGLNDFSSRPFEKRRRGRRDRKLRCSFLSNRLELRFLLVAQRRIEALERGAHQMDRPLHGIEPTLRCVKASG
jgi:hypothetical protein